MNYWLSTKQMREREERERESKGSTSKTTFYSVNINERITLCFIKLRCSHSGWSFIAPTVSFKQQTAKWSASRRKLLWMVKR